MRARYERGDISFDRFEYALSALLVAQTPEQCRTIIQELPSEPLAVFDALTTPPPPLAPPAAAPRPPYR